MSEYKENTVGWWLSQLKQPLRSKATKAFSEFHNSPVSESTVSPSMALAISSFGWSQTEDFDNFWIGVKDFFLDYRKRDNSQEYISGYNMAKECAPDNWLKPKDGGEDKAIVDSPEKPEYWVDGEIRKYREHLLKGGVEYADTERGKVKLVADSPAREIEAPERAVVGYEEPKPIDTIEKKHELRIKNLEAYNKYQAERNQQIMDLNPHVDFCDSEGNLVRPSRMTALEARVKELEDQLFKLLGSKNG